MIMKNILLSSLFALITTLGFSQVPSYVPVNGLVGWWPFNGNADDESGSNHNLIPSGDASLSNDRNGLQQSAFSLSDVINNSRLEFNLQDYSLVDNFNQGSLSIWLKITFHDITNHYFGFDNMFMVRQKSGVNTQFYLGLLGGTMKLRMHLNGGLPNSGDLTSNLSLSLNTWCNIVYTWDSSVEKIYINGVLDNSLNSSNSITALNSPDMFCFGSFGGVGGNSTNSILDDIGIWNRALTDCEIQNLYNSSNPTNTTAASACNNYTWNGTTYTTSGVYTGPTTNCVTETLNLTITPSSTNTTAASACNSYTWNGTTFTASGVYTGPTTNCVTESLDLTITQSSTNTTTASACNSYTWNGQTYTQSGTYTGTTANCVTESLNLTITPSSTNTTTAATCDSYIWNGTTYSASGVYTGTTTNCVTEFLNLTITPSSTNTTTASACNSYVWNGTSYSASGVYTGTTANCVTQALNLTINSSTSSSISQTALDSYTWPANNQSYTTSGAYTAVIPNAAGCDSTITLNLTMSFTGINDINASKISIYPNPTNGDFTITGLELVGTVSSLSLTDMNGKVVKVLDTKATKFSMASIKPGVYFLNIRADNKQEVLKIVKE